jgi:hypothetical protein
VAAWRKELSIRHLQMDLLRVLRIFIHKLDSVFISSKSADALAHLSHTLESLRNYGYGASRHVLLNQALQRKTH